MQCALDVEELAMLIGHTTTPHTLLPSNAAWAAEELDFRGPHIELRQACTGFSAAALCAASFIDGGARSIALAGSEVGSVMLDSNRIAEDPVQLVNMLQMGDGAGAIVLGHVQHSQQARLECLFYGSLEGMHAPAISLPHGGSASPAVPAPGITHFDHDYGAIRDHGSQLLSAGLAAAAALGVAPESVDWWIPQPVNGRMADICASDLGVPVERVIVAATGNGNLGSAAMWVALDQTRRSGRLRRGDRVLVLGAEASKFMYGGFLYVHSDGPLEAS
jgi:3-oxoacyl-[acyl-carrier-protein] synthase-3